MISPDCLYGVLRSVSFFVQNLTLSRKVSQVFFAHCVSKRYFPACFGPGSFCRGFCHQGYRLALGIFCQAQPPGLGPPTHFARWAAARIGNDGWLWQRPPPSPPGFTGERRPAKRRDQNQFIPCQTPPTWLSSTALTHSPVLNKTKACLFLPFSTR